jgi:phage shock protein C
MNGKRLVLSQNKQFLGVCGGIADYMGVDPTVVRVLWVVGTFLTAIIPATILYFVLGFVMPAE